MATATTCTVLGLTNGDRYRFAVVAATAIGSGPSATSNVATPATIPGAPTITRVIAGDRFLTVDWKAPASTGGTAVASYRVTGSPGGVFCHVPGVVDSCRVVGLRNGREYRFTVTATNAAGTGPASLVSAPLKPGAIPGAPIVTSARAVGRRIIVMWRPPRSNGGIHLSGYEIYVGPVPGGEGTQPLNSRPLKRLSFKFRGRKNFSVFLYVRAVNAAGIGPRSAEVVATVRH